MTTRSTPRVLGALAALAAFIALPAAAQGDYPNKTIKIVVSFSAGGTTDVTARRVAERLSHHLKQPVVVENKPGAGGTLGTDFVARQPADGYTLLMTSSGPVSISPSLSKKLATDPLTEIIPVIAVVDVPNVLVVYPGLPVKNLDEFLKYGKARNGDINYGSTGVGTVAHLAGADFADRVGLKALHIPYKGAEAVTDVMTGRTQFMFATLPSVVGHIKSGKLRALAAVTDKRSSAIPDVPTMSEAGVKGMETGAWFGLFAPKGTPPAIVQKLNTAINEILKEKAVADAFSALGADPMGGSPADFARKIKADHDEWKAIVQRAGVTVD